MRLLGVWLIVAWVLLAGPAWATPEVWRDDFRKADRAFNRGELAAAEAIYAGLSDRTRAVGDLASTVQALQGLAAVYLSSGRDVDLQRCMEQIKGLRPFLDPRQPAAIAPNLLADGDFERGLVPPWGTGHYETGNFSFGMWWNSEGCRSFAKVDTDVAHDGSASLRISNFSPGRPRVFGTTSQRIRNVTPNTVYEVELWARAEKLGPAAVQIILDPGWMVRPITLPPGTYGWTRFRVQVNSGDLSFIDFRILHQNLGTAWLDGLSIRPLQIGEAPADPLVAADALMRRGEIRQAIDQYQGLEKQWAADPARLNAVLERLGNAWFEAGEYDRAVEYLLRLPNNVRAWLALGDVLQNLGQLDKALERYQAVYRKVVGNQAFEAIASDRTAMTLLRQGKLADAMAWETQALNVMTHINDPHGRASSLLHLGQMQIQAGSPGPARVNLNEALRLSRVTGDRKLESDARQYLGLASTDQLPAALDHLRAAVQLRRAVHDGYGLIYSLYWLGHFQRLAGDRDGALAALREAVEALEAVRDRAGSIEKGGDSLLASNEPVFEEIVALLIAMGRSEEALDYLNRSRSNQLRKLFEQQDARPRAQARQAYGAMRSLEMEREVLESRLRAELARPEAQRDAKLVQEVEAAKATRQVAYREMVRDIFRKHPDLAGLVSINPTTLKQRQSSLPQGAAIVEYMAGETQTYVFAVTRDRLSVRILDLPRRTLTADVLALRHALLRGRASDTVEARASRPVSAPAPASDEALRARCRALYEKLFRPLEGDLPGIHTLRVIPNGILHYLPFQMLAPDDRNYLVDRYAILYLCEESFTRPPVSTRLHVYQKLLLLGNPDGSLQHAESEVRRILELYPQSSAFVGPSVHKGMVRKGFEGLHIASHGVLDGSDVAESYIVMAPEAAGKEAARLTLREVWGLDLEGVDLVTLSACSTAVGEQSPGDELISLENAFIFAGASSVVASLWNVQDEATAKLMERFYANLKTMDKAEALQTAQCEVKRTMPHPFYWAPFILVGP